MVTAATDNTLKVVDVRKNTQTLCTLEDGDLIIAAAISKFTISPNGKFCIIGGHQGMIFIFNLETG